MLTKQIFSRRNILHCILFACIPALLFYGFSLLALKSTGFNLIEILRDPAQQNEQSSLIGFVSNIGVWLWVSSTAICFFSAIANASENKGRQRELLILLGILSMFLAMDDFFLIHDRYINEKICYLAYALLAGSLLFRHYRQIIKIDIFPFLFAGSLLALSILTDLTQDYLPLPYSHTQVFEEGFKFIGGATWLYFSYCIASFRTNPFPKTPQIRDSSSTRYR